MENIDLRTLSAEARKEIRQAAVRMYKKGHRKSDIAESLGLRKTTVGQWINAYEKQGPAALKERERGRPAGIGRTLTPEQEARIRRDIVDHTPDQLKMGFALWNAHAVRSLIRRYFGVDMPVRTVRSYLQRWGFTPQRPLKRAYEQKPELVQKWMTEEYPAIAERAKAEGAEIQWGDETGVSSVEHYPRGYAPKGETPVLVLSQAKRERVNLISSISNQGKVRFMLYQDSFTADVMIKFLERLIRDSDKKVFLILDNLRVHHSKKVKAWLAGKEDLIELFFLPSYSPELNPDEYLNCDLKASLSRGEPARGKGQMKKKVLSLLRSLQKQPGRVRSYFQAEKIRYAAA
jgi:transposase